MSDRYDEMAEVFVAKWHEAIRNFQSPPSLAAAFRELAIERNEAGFRRGLRAQKSRAIMALHNEPTANPIDVLRSLPIDDEPEGV